MTVEEILSRIRAHRRDMTALLEQTVETARGYPGLGLADSISYLARAHALLAGELVELSEDEPAGSGAAEDGRAS